MVKMDSFVRSYIETAFWSSSNWDNMFGDNPEPFDATHGLEDLAPEALARMVKDCQDFLDKASYDDIATCERTDDYMASAGHDFWLNRNGHGAGFWDGDYEEQAGKRLDALAHSFGECDLYLGDDGLVYCS